MWTTGKLHKKSKHS